MRLTLLMPGPSYPGLGTQPGEPRLSQSSGRAEPFGYLCPYRSIEGTSAALAARKCSHAQKVCIYNE